MIDVVRGANRKSAYTQLNVFLLIAGWVVASTVVVLINKQVLFYEGFHLPFTLATAHMLSTSILALIWKTCQSSQSDEPTPSMVSRSFFVQLAGIAMLYGVSLVMANGAYMYLSVPAIQMLKASGPAIMYFIGLAMGTTVFAFSASLQVLVAVVGVAVASYTHAESHFNGVFLQIGAMVFDSLRMCSLQIIMQAHALKLTPHETLSKVAPLTFVVLIICVSIIEGEKLWTQQNIPWIWISASCLAACAVNILGFTLIARTSALTMSMTAPIKEWVTIFTAIALHGTHVTNRQWLGYSIALVGVAAYQWSTITLSGKKIHIKSHEDSVHKLEEHNSLPTLLAANDT